jgi:hypothetical protein
MGNKTSKPIIKQSTEIQQLTELYNNKKWEELINTIEPLFTKRDKNLNIRTREEQINLGILLRKILISIPEDDFHNLVNNKNMNCYFLINTFKNDKNQLEYILRSKPQKYLLPAITKLSDYYISYLIDFGAKPSKYIISKSIKHRSNKIFNLLIDEFDKEALQSKEIDTKREDKKEEFYKICLDGAVLYEKKDIILSLLSRIKFENIDFNRLYDKCFDDDIKQFLDKILETRISKVV